VAPDPDPYFGNGVAGDYPSQSSAAGSGASDAGGSWDAGASTPAPVWTRDAWSPSPADAALSDPRSLFEALLPTFESRCGPCHVQGTDNAPPYLGGADPYTTIKTYAGVVVANPQQSILLTKGAHQGPALVDPLRASITTWLTAEAAGAPAGPVTTAPFAVTTGANQVDLSTLVPGAAITFTAATSGDYLDLTAIELIAPSGSTVTVTYPIFYVVPASGPQIQDNDFSNVNQTIAAGQTDPLGPGLLSIEGWATGDQLRIAFKGLVASGGGGASGADGGAPTASGACLSPSRFTTNVVPVINENGCLSCHGTGGSGNGALDLSPLQQSPADDVKACVHALTKVNLVNPAESPIIQAPTGGIAGHPFTTATSDFAPAVERWIQAEE
jgi:hypothetical protein